MSDQTPADPFGGMAAHAVGVHEMFVSYQAAGFTPGEALYLVGIVLAAAAQAAGSS